MTDTTIPRTEAIARMAKGEPCETCSATEWFPTRWEHFDPPYSHAKFRIPPEPRRGAREWRRVTGLCFSDDHPVNLVRPIHVREVLPDEVTLAKMPEEEVRSYVSRLADCEANSMMADDCVSLFRALNLIL